MERLDNTIISVVDMLKMPFYVVSLILLFCSAQKHR